ncbi:MAG: aminotransferase class I/II-fold pyridoxal phosphate-dependent enzyme [Actinomycetota bacterium]|nr:aminotransferase class I/II-fold pyridoxal phosphate-dependent enzyme [Actinomycetota bacterium]
MVVLGLRLLHPRHRIDASCTDILTALAACILAPAGRSDRHGNALVCLSVRSAFDLLLTALALREGDEILVSAVTHPDMVRIAKLHGLRPVPVDIDPWTMVPDPLALREAIRDRSRAILVAHLFGARVDLEETAEVARQHGLLLVEDCAQSIEGPDDEGDARADVSLFSFGFIKTATALGGALAWVRNPHLAAAMGAVQEQWPVQPRCEYARRALTGLTVLALSHPSAFGLVARSGRDPADLVRSLPAADDQAFLRRVRRRPSAPLVRTLRRRLRRFPSERLRARAAAGEELARALPAGLFLPAGGTARTTHWLFPALTDDPAALIEGLRREGFDASQGASQIEAVEPAPPCAAWLMAGIVFLPVYPEMPLSERQRLARVIRELV